MLADNGVLLVFGGGRFGIMGAVAKGVLQNGGTIIPVSTESVWELETNQMHNVGAKDEVFDYTEKVKPIMAEDIVERKRILRDMGDACCAFPGSIGTFDELCEVLCLAYLKEYNKPCVIFDIDNYWRGLKQLFDDAISHRFALPGIKNLYSFVDDVHDILPAAERYAKSD